MPEHYNPSSYPEVNCNQTHALTYCRLCSRLCSAQPATDPLNDTPHFWGEDLYGASSIWFRCPKCLQLLFVNYLRGGRDAQA